MERTPVIIKKYENRRLYDSTNSRYINLEEVAQMVQEGREVQVVDATSGEDLTRLVLTQIIVEQAKTPGSAFPLDILRQMVSATNRASQETALNYAKAMYDLYQNAYRSLPMPLSPFGFIPAPGTQRPANADAAPPANAPAEGHESRELKRRVAELESIVSNLGARKSARKKRAKPRRRA
ncbi:MAG: polyhydroxyalkanoate synthesis regulator DNA-binding domain-containing protein [Terriglobales bacterium]